MEKISSRRKVGGDVEKLMKELHDCSEKEAAILLRLIRKARGKRKYQRILRLSEKFDIEL